MNTTSLLLGENILMSRDNLMASATNAALGFSWLPTALCSLRRTATKKCDFNAKLDRLGKIRLEGRGASQKVGSAVSS